jgi:hypothetical protein
MAILQSPITDTSGFELPVPVVQTEAAISCDVLFLRGGKRRG